MKFFHQSALISKGKLCPLTIILIITAPILHKLLKKKLWWGWGERPSVCDHLDVKEMSVSNILGALTHKTVFKFHIPSDIIKFQIDK